jgi:hypothetical protein
MGGREAASPTRNRSTNAAMSASERRDLLRIIREHEKLLKKEAAEQSARLLADFERELTEKIDEVSRGKAEKIVGEETETACIRARGRCKEAGIPSQFIDLVYVHGGVRDSKYVHSVVYNMRRTAESEIKAREKAALTSIQRESLTLQTEVIADGLGSTTAHAFLERFSTVEALMPPLDFLQIESKIVN